MRYLKTYKIFENSIDIRVSQSFHGSVMNKYINELGTTLQELNDIFRDVLDLDYNSYLQLFYLNQFGARYSSLPGQWLNSDDK